MMLSSTQWRIVKLVGYPAFFLLCFAVFMFWTFPVDRFKPQIEEKLAATLGREVGIGEVSMSLTGSFTLEAVEIGTASEAGEVDREAAAMAEFERIAAGGDTDEDGKPAEKPAPKPKYLIEEIEIDVGFIDFLFGQLDVEVEAELLGGEIAISYEGPLGGEDEVLPPRTGAARRAAEIARRSQAVPPVAALDGETPDAEAEAEAEDGEPVALSVQATGIQLRQIHDLRRKVPVAVGGALDVRVELTSETGRLADFDGRISVAARQLKVGDSKNPATIGGMPMTVDEVLVSELAWEIDVKKGVGAVEKFTVASADFDAKIEGTISFADPFSRSRLDLYLTFKLLEGYAKRSPTAQMVVSTLPELSSDFRRALRSDGYFGFRYRGVLGSAQFTPAKVYRGKGTREAERAERRAKRTAATPSARAGDRAAGRGTALDERAAGAGDVDPSGMAREERFPDLKPPSGSGPYGVDPVPLPTATDRPQNQPDEGRRIDAEARALPEPPAEEVEEPLLDPEPERVEEQPGEQPEEQPGEQPEEEEEGEGEAQEAPEQ